MSMRAALIEAREYIADDLRKIIDNSSIDGIRATIHDNDMPWVEKAEGLLAKIDAALSAEPTDQECAAGLDAWFGDFGPEARGQFVRDADLIARMRRALIAARDARP